MEKIFTTEDLVDIFPGQKYFSVNIESYPSRFSDSIIPPFQIVGPYVNPRAEFSDSGILKYFSTRSAASEWIRKNMWEKIK
jgi:hypothetical protein